jgi:hypothetical protein
MSKLNLNGLVGITGYAQHGKDSLANLFVADGWTKLAFADQLRKALYVLNPWVSLGEVEPAVTRRYASLIDELGYEATKAMPEARRLLQVMGTEVVRDIIGEDAWVKALGKRIVDHGPGQFVIPDVRFPNEAAFIRQHLGYLVFVDRPDFDNGIAKDHPSEAFIGKLREEADLVITAYDLNELELVYKTVLADG